MAHLSAETPLPNIILTGFMGTGKTTVGKQLAAMLGYRFVDTDVFIQSRSQMTIAAIFAELGEPAFRQMELDAAIELATETKQVIATGGGMLLNPDVVAAFSNAQIVCLTAKPETILLRVLNDAKRIERPLLKAPDPALRIHQLLSARHAAYAQFTQIATDDLTPPEIAQSILTALASDPSP